MLLASAMAAIKRDAWRCAGTLTASRTSANPAGKDLSCCSGSMRISTCQGQLMGSALCDFISAYSLRSHMCGKRGRCRAVFVTPAPTLDMLMQDIHSLPAPLARQHGRHCLSGPQRLPAGERRQWRGTLLSDGPHAALGKFCSSPVPR